MRKLKTNHRNTTYKKKKSQNRWLDFSLNKGQGDSVHMGGKKKSSRLHLGGKTTVYGRGYAGGDGEKRDLGNKRQRTREGKCREVQFHLLSARSLKGKIQKEKGKKLLGTTLQNEKSNQRGSKNRVSRIHGKVKKNASVLKVLLGDKPLKPTQKKRVTE